MHAAVLLAGVKVCTLAFIALSNMGKAKRMLLISKAVFASTAVTADSYKTHACTYTPTELEVHAGDGMLTVALKMLHRVRVCLPLTAVRSMVSCKLYTPWQKRMCRLSMRQQEACVLMRSNAYLGRVTGCPDISNLQVTAWLVLSI